MFHAGADMLFWFFFFSTRRRHTRCLSDWSSDVCSSDLYSASTPRLSAAAALARCLTMAVGELESVTLVIRLVSTLRYAVTRKVPLSPIQSAPASAPHRVSGSSAALASVVVLPALNVR